MDRYFKDRKVKLFINAFYLFIGSKSIDQKNFFERNYLFKSLEIDLMDNCILFQL